ncbi:MAG: aminotransferase class I/II-fold pyridoxal phosphate-dependent enzyme [Bacteroidetes bacterium]|nr:MAG: aminotransferase class I/II-fold pyridoxal phosphate-dependent enzyme [Bacteroidota bacterium]
MQIKSKLPDVGTTIFTVMSKMASDHQAINLAQGFPNFPVDQRLVDQIANNLNKPYHQYAPMPGNPNLLLALSELTEKHYGRQTPQEEILVCAGATQAIYTAIQALVHPGEEVIIIDPAYDCYDPAVRMAGAKAVHIPMLVGFEMDWDRIEQSIHEQTRMLIVNNPHNPSGRVFRQSDVEALRSIMQKHPHLLLLSDEVYEYISFDEAHHSAHELKEFRDRILVVSSFGKSFHITGWKLGYLISDEALMKEIKKVHQFLVFSVNNLAQQSLADYLNLIDLSELAGFYKQKRDHFAGLIAPGRFRLLPSEGTYFQALDYSEISKEKDTEFVQRMVREHGVAAIPMSAFYASENHDRVIRLCFAKDEETLEKAAEKLCRI